MNRREFLKGGLGGLFGAALTWAGAVKAEEAQQDEREFCDAGCANCPYWDSCDNAPQDYGPQVNTEEAQGPKFGEVDCNSYSDCSDCPARPRCETEPGPAQVPDNVSWEDVPPERDPCDSCTCRAECDADSVYWCSVEGIETRANNPWAPGGAPIDYYRHIDIPIGGAQVSDNVSWDYSPETGGAYPAVTNRDLAGWDGVNDWCDWPPKGTTWFLDEVHGNDANDGLEPETALLTREELYSRLCQEEIPSQDVTVTLPGDGSEIVSFQDSYYDDDGTLIALGPARNFQHNPDSDLGRLFSQTGQIDWPRTRAVLEEIGLLPRESATSDQAFGAIVESANKWNAQVSDNVSWDYSADTGGAPMTVPASLTDCTSSEPWEGGFKRSAVDGHLVCWDSAEGSDENGVGVFGDPVATEACAQSIADLG